MANGLSPLSIQSVLAMLMQGRDRNPVGSIPLAPVGDFGPLSMETTAALAALNPEPVPPALSPPVDADAIRSRFAGMLPPEPVAPVAQPISLIQKIALALQGFGAGTQGQGPQFLAGLREERERPQREFRAKKERFESQRQELGLLAEQEVSRAEDRRAARNQQLLDRQFDREFETNAQRMNLRGQKERDLLLGAMRAKEQRENDERAAIKEEKEKKAKQEEAARKFTAELLTGPDAAPPNIAKELGRFAADLIPKLSPAAEKWRNAQARRAEILARGGGGGRAVQPRWLIEVVKPDGSLSVGPLTPQVGEQLQNQPDKIKLGPRGIFIEGQSGQPAAVPTPITGTFGLSSLPDIFSPPAPQPQQQGGQRVFTRAQVEATARRQRKTPQEIEAAIRAKGGSVQ